METNEIDLIQASVSFKYRLQVQHWFTHSHEDYICHSMFEDLLNSQNLLI